jgi:hypothetical protein
VVPVLGREVVEGLAALFVQKKGENQLPKVVQGVTFTNGVEVTDTSPQNAA